MARASAKAISNIKNVLEKKSLGAIEQSNISLMTARPPEDLYTIVKTRAEAIQVARRLRQEHFIGCVHAVDTETVGCDPSWQSPVKKAELISASIYSGPQVDFGNGPHLWIDNSDEDLIHEFRDFFTDPRYKKVFHNYSYDYHVIGNYAIRIEGFYGDTMHMARLLDSDRLRYSLDSLSKDYLRRRKIPFKELFKQHGRTDSFKNVETGKDESQKVEGEKDSAEADKGSPAKRRSTKTDDFTEDEEDEDYSTHSTIWLQKNPKTRAKWIDYCVYDTEATWLLYHELKKRLSKCDWKLRNSCGDSNARSAPAIVDFSSRREIPGSLQNRKLFKRQNNLCELCDIRRSSTCGLLTGQKGAGKPPETSSPSPSPQTVKNTQKTQGKAPKKSMYDFYTQFYVPFAQLLVEMEQLGAFVDVYGAIRESKNTAYYEATQPVDDFKSWVGRYVEDYENFNPRSSRQMQQLLFAPRDEDDVYKSNLKPRHTFKIENVNGVILPGRKKPNKMINFEVQGLGMKPLTRTKGGKPQCNASTFEELGGRPLDDPPAYGKAYRHFLDPKEGHDACEALFRLSEALKVDTLLSSYIENLESCVDDFGRIHTSLNLRTNTGRLSSRSPNLQCMPAADKDTFKTRKAFRSFPQNLLIVADYSQLELRVLAHMANCKSMIDAFAAGGDFHSHTAVQMFDHVRQAVESGRVTISKSQNKKTVKEVFPSERKKAKTFNFSVVYGKTSFGFAKDFDVTEKEAKEYLELWYKERPEVQEWQARTVRESQRSGLSRSLLGRFRRVKNIGRGRKVSDRDKGHAERVAINTPVQGGAADIVMGAMLKLHNCHRLNLLGWKMILQIHDEVILEGPKSTVKEALEIAKNILEHPFEREMRVALEVNIAAGETWFDAK